MDKLDFIGFLRDYCNENGIYFIPGPEAYENAVADYHVYDDYELILTADFSLSPNFETDEITYFGTLGLGRKREETTMSSLDEFFIQKYDNRLLELSKKLYLLIESISCEEEFTIDGCEMSYALNRFDLNADFVLANITIRK